MILDSRSAELSGSGTSVMAHLWDTKPPLNLNDSDLSPNMREPPVEHTGMTEMAFCMLRLEIGRFMRHPNSLGTFDGEIESFSSIAVFLSEKDAAIDELERNLERKFLRFCDPMIPLHVLVTCVARCAVYKLRLIAHHPRQYPDRPTFIPQGEKDMLFSNSLKMVEQDNHAHSNKSTQRFLWHVKVYFQLEALAYLLNELRERTAGESVARAWRQLDELFEHHPDMMSNRKNALFVAIQNLTLKAWEARETAFARQNHGTSGTTLKPPRVISILLSQRRPIMAARAVASSADDGLLLPLPPQMNGQSRLDGPYPSSENHLGDISNNYGLPMFSDSLQTDMNPMDWAYWDDLIRGDLQMFEGDEINVQA